MDAEALIKFEEGCELVGYLDTEGVPTIGRGHTGPEVHVGLVWSQAQVDEAFAKDAATAQSLVERTYPWFATLDDMRAAVMVSLMFQLGPKRLALFVHFLGAMRDRRWNDAAGQLRSSRLYTQTRLRTERAARAIETGETQWT